MEEIPPYVPPPEVQIETTAPPPPAITIQTTVPRPDPPRVVVTPPPPAPPAGPTQRATPRGRLGATITTDDYPDASLRAEEQGVTNVRYEINEQGRVSPGSCQVTRSSGHDRLDRRTCELVERRFRFNPALQGGKPVKESRTQAVRWQIPED
jgi:protein TonB